MYLGLATTTTIFYVRSYALNMHAYGKQYRRSECAKLSKFDCFGAGYSAQCNVASPGRTTDDFEKDAAR